MSSRSQFNRRPQMNADATGLHNLCTAVRRIDLGITASFSARVEPSDNTVLFHAARCLTVLPPRANLAVASPLHVVSNKILILQFPTSIHEQLN